MIEELKSVFSEIYLHFYGETYVFANKHVEKQLNDFIKIAPKNAGENWIKEFTIFQFSYYSNMKTRFNRVFINWIYGRNALKRWANRTEQQQFYANEFKNRIGYRIVEVEKMDLSELNHTERNRFKGEDFRQFIHCAENVLFDKNSDDCKKCKFFKTCS